MLIEFRTFVYLEESHIFKSSVKLPLLVKKKMSNCPIMFISQSTKYRRVLHL